LEIIWILACLREAASAKAGAWDLSKGSILSQEVSKE
jgi:hypothetical protein